MEEFEVHYPYPVDREVDYVTEPECSNWALTPLYKTSLDGKTSFWQIGFFEDGEHLWISHGLTISDPQTKTREVKTNNSGRSMQEQALLEARNRYKKMHHKGYRLALGEVCIKQPMLANQYNGKNVKSFPVMVQPKLDGVRALISIENKQVKIHSRTNREWSFLASIRDEAEQLLSLLPPGCVLDGEMYSTELSFDQLSGLMRTTKGNRSAEDKVKYYVFDVMDENRSYTEVRSAMLDKAFEEFSGKRIVMVPNFVASSHEDIIRAHQIFTSQGMEGCMIRRLSFAESNKDLCLYKPSRCNNLLKCKTFDDEEVTILGVKEGEGTEKGLAIFYVQDDEGAEFEVRPGGSFTQRKEWFDNPELVLGQKYTIKFFGRTPHGVPRFPVGLALRNYE